METLPIGKLVEPEHIVRVVVSEDGIASLAWSIKQVGLIEPIVVRQKGDVYEVIAGHRRLLACRAAGLVEVPVVVVPEGAGEVADAMKFHENLYRADITSVEEATYMAELIDRGSTVQQVADLVRHPESYVRARLKILEYDPLVIAALQTGNINVSVATVLMRCKREESRKVLLQHAVREGATAGNVAEWVQNQNYLDGFVTAPNAKGLPPEVQKQMEEDRFWNCMLCGGTEDKHMMVTKMVHNFCFRVMEIQGGLDAGKQSGEQR